MILEVLHPDGARTRHRLDVLPLTVGRGLGNGLVLDDPYVDARHARIVFDEAGAPRVEDLGSVNGLVEDGARHAGAIAVTPGAEVRIGRTTLRFRDSDEPVPPALVDHNAVPPPRRADLHPAGARVAAGARGRRPRAVEVLSRLVATTPGRLVIAAAAVGAFAVHSWLGSYERSSASGMFASALVVAIGVAIWAGIWSVASRASVQRFNFVGHVGVASAVVLAGLGWSVLDEWSSFIAPDAGIWSVLWVVVGFALAAALIAGHLALASTMTRRRQWRAAAIVAASLWAVGMLAELAEDDEFSDVPTFSGVVKPVGASWLPMATIDDFGEVMLELKESVDGLAEK
ncbi:MAG TPA: FHA domain-containing protein [Gemmatimonadaceae bacterium]|nr:FHA domain-containing protein [Gemmatimonadaceae bacterium]